MKFNTSNEWKIPETTHFNVRIGMGPGRNGEKSTFQTVRVEAKTGQEALDKVLDMIAPNRSKT